MTDPFSALGVAPRYDLDLGALERQHRELSRALHPDRYVGRSASERREALGRAIAVNDAWRVLRDPVGRAEALLEKLGMAAQRAPEAAPEFLAEMLEEREILAEASARKDLAEVRRLAGVMRERERVLTGELAEAFAGLAGDPTRVTELYRKLGELRYARRYLDEAGNIEDDLL